MKKYTLLLFALLLGCLTGCKQDVEFGDAIYMTGTLNSPTLRFLVDGQSSMGLTVTSTAKADADVKVTMKTAPELLDAFNPSTGRNCLLPPDGSYTISGL